MDRRSIVLVVTLFLLVVVGMFVFAYLNRTETVVVSEVVEEPVVVPYADITRIDAKHFYAEGVHTFVGEVVLPTPCDLLEVTSVVREAMPEQVVLDFKVINNAEACAAVLTNARFQVSAEASEMASVEATFMGRPIVLNLIPAAEGETPEDFELFIKG